MSKWKTTACGGEKKADTDTEGDDWRSSGEVVASGTITHKNEGSVAVLVTVDEYSAAFSTDWQKDVDDWKYVLTKSCVVYLPEGYDGLILGAVPQQDNYEDCLKMNQMDGITPGASIMDIDLIDPYSCLFFSICD